MYVQLPQYLFIGLSLVHIILKVNFIKLKKVLIHISNHGCTYESLIGLVFKTKGKGCNVEVTTSHISNKRRLLVKHLFHAKYLKSTMLLKYSRLNDYSLQSQNSIIVILRQCLVPLGEGKHYSSQFDTIHSIGRSAYYPSP